MIPALTAVRRGEKGLHYAEASAWQKSAQGHRSPAIRSRTGSRFWMEMASRRASRVSCVSHAQTAISRLRTAPARPAMMRSLPEFSNMLGAQAGANKCLPHACSTAISQDACCLRAHANTPPPVANRPTAKDRGPRDAESPVYTKRARRFSAAPILSARVRSASLAALLLQPEASNINRTPSVKDSSYV